MSSEFPILIKILEACENKDLRKLSEGIEQLRADNKLSDTNKSKIISWIDQYFPISLREVAVSLLEADEEEKEPEEKSLEINPKNTCSSDTQKDLIGNSFSPTLHQVITFLLPKSKKSECITESDMMKILTKAEKLYLYDEKKKELLKSVMIHRLPTAGIWIVGNPMYFLLLRAYKLESFGKHIISSEHHEVGSIWRQEHELFLAKPIHFKDLSSFIKNNTDIPSASSCACMFKPENDDWSSQSKANFPVDECKWLLPTWNGIPICLGETCGEVLNWTQQQLFRVLERRESRYPNGNLKEVSFYLNGRLEGESKKWYENGQLEQQAIYRNGNINGEFRWWYENGQIWMKKFFRDGELEGENRLWYENGQLESETTWKNGKEDGESRSWYKNGKLSEQEFYRNGELEGERKRWYENGQLRVQEFYRNGKWEGERKFWYANGQLRVQAFYRDGKREGERKSWYKNGQLEKHEIYRDGKLEK